MKVYYILLYYLFISSALLLRGQFAPRAGEPGSTAMAAQAGVWTGWAQTCEVTRGYLDITQPSNDTTSAGTPESALGPALENGVVSLGDGGHAILTFSPPLMDGAGADFAVFENGFYYLDSLDFLELAFVEVSSDGIHYVRFPTQYLGDTVNQIGSFEGIDTRKIEGFAGKYTSGWGTPFDLSQLPSNSWINPLSVPYVKIMDVIGILDTPWVSKDVYHRKINDPWPTAFPTGGFDLDAVGAIHQGVLNTENAAHNPLVCWPQPLKLGEGLNVPVNVLQQPWTITDLQGRILDQGIVEEILLINFKNVPSGIFCLQIGNYPAMRICVY